MNQLPEGAVSEPGPHDELRGELRERGVDTDHISDHALGYVVEAVDGDLDLAADAVAMDPRVAWVEEFTGPHARGE